MRNMRKNMGVWLLSKCQFACQSCVCLLVRAILFGPAWVSPYRFSQGSEN